MDPCPCPWPPELATEPLTGSDPTAEAVLWLDPQGLVVAGTAQARRLLAEQADKLRLVNGQLRAPGEQQRLAGFLDMARQRGAAALRLAQAQGPELSLSASLQRQGPAAGLLRLSLHDPHSLQPDIESLALLFGLTRSEARVASGLAMGQDSRQLAQELGTQTNTVLAHIKKLLTKTGTRRQAALVSLLWRSARPRHGKPADQQGFSAPREPGGRTRASARPCPNGQ